jgi:hypothetical protein
MINTSYSFSCLTVGCSLDINACIEVWPSIAIVSALSTIEFVITFLATEAVITRAAIDDVITLPAHEGVTTTAAMDMVITLIPLNQ